jgi:hypothetical protein
MTEPDAGQDARNPYLSTNIEHEAPGSLEATAFFLEATETDPDMWKWAVVALHNAVQGFMVLALTHGTNWGTLRDQDIARKVQADFDHRRALQGMRQRQRQPMRSCSGRPRNWHHFSPSMPASRMTTGL